MKEEQFSLLNRLYDRYPGLLDQRDRISEHWTDWLLCGLTACVAVCLDALVLMTLSSCSSDDDPDVTPVATGIEVCIVFAPNELGDQGYADRVLTGMHQFDMQLSEDDYSRVQLRYIAVSDTDAVKNELRLWDQQGTSPYNERAYERRLLVLTDARLLPYLAETPLSDTDEVLVMNVANQQFDQMPEARQLGSRLHLLSISAAGSAHRLWRHIDFETSHPDEVGFQRGKAINILLLQGHNADEVLADSIAEVLDDYRSDATSITVYPSGDTVGAGDDAYAKTYMLAYLIAQTNSETYSYVVCNWGAYNASFYAGFHLWGTGSCEAIFLDTEIFISDSKYPTIVRHYDRALSQWLARWLRAPVGAMPEKEWHGAWDGYTTDNIPTYND
ncbi:MAG: hypothetical protein II864_05585 [Prevotella sp.]|nr:hypothetical protein [Prevotella sp.]